MTAVLEELLAEHALRTAPEAMITALCPTFSDRYYNTQTVIDILQRYEDIRSPCSLNIHNSIELAAHKSIIHAIGLAHYARASRVASDFPYRWCGRASHNVLLSLWQHNYPMASAARSQTHDHTYITLPFVMPERTGVLILDPTAAQTNDGWPLVTLEEREGSVWEYRTPHWEESADLYPERILDLCKCRQVVGVYEKSQADSLRLGQGEQRSAREFYEEAFRHPIDAQTTSHIGEILKNLVTG